MKRIFSAALIMLLTFITVLSLTDTALAKSFLPISTDAGAPAAAPSISSEKAIVADNTTGTILYSKGNLTSKIYPASLTKIITALVTAENVDDPDNAIVTVSRKACNLTSGASVMGLEPGDKISVTDLLYGLLLRSGNDAAIALAEFVGGSVDSFVEMMNNKAAEMGAVNTNFKNPHGMHNEEHYSCMNDMLIFASVLTENQTLAAIVSTYSHTVNITRRSNKVTLELTNTNQLLNRESTYYNKYFTGMKTGTTNAAGYCLASRYQKNGKDLLILTFKGHDENFYSDTLKLAEYADASFAVVNLREIFAARDFAIKIDNASAADSNNGLLTLRFSEVPDITYTTTSALAQAIKNQADPLRIVLPENLSAPIYTGDSVGKATIYMGENILLEGELIATRTVLDHIEVPDDLVALYIQNERPASLWSAVLIVLGVLVGIAVVFALFLIIKLIIHNKKQRSGRRSNVYSRRSRPTRTSNGY